MPDEWAVIAGDSHDTIDSDACPSEANTCGNMSGEDREKIMDDLDFHLNWDDPECVEVRDHLRERFLDPYALVGKFDDFDDDGYPQGHWRKWFDDEDEVWKRGMSFNESYLTGGSRDLGWAGHRAKMGIHEGHHDKFESSESEAYAFEEQCIHY